VEKPVAQPLDGGRRYGLLWLVSREFGSFARLGGRDRPRIFSYGCWRLWVTSDVDAHDALLGSLCTLTLRTRGSLSGCTRLRRVVLPSLAGLLASLPPISRGRGLNFGRRWRGRRNVFTFSGHFSGT
jgi:hypothetical protein